MTLTEYINQNEPQRMPNVILQEGEFTCGQPFKAGNDILQMVTIPILWEKYKIGRPYIKVNDSKQLYTTDENGNKRRISCFRLP